MEIINKSYGKIIQIIWAVVGIDDGFLSETTLELASTFTSTL
jgi:hypothetical protein